MSYFLRTFLGTILLLLGVFYLSSCESTSIGQTNVMGEPSVVGVESSAPSCANVSYVIDGDTLVVEPDRTIRLVGIDTPEMGFDGDPSEDFAEESYTKLRTLVAGKKVCLEAEPQQDDRDVYDRELRYVFVDDIFVNELMVQEGFATVYRNAPFQYKQEFLYYESAAQEQGIGMWEKAKASSSSTSITTTGDTVVGVTTTPDTRTTVEIPVKPVEKEIPSFDASMSGPSTWDSDFLSVEEAIKAKKYLGKVKKVSFKVQSAWDRGQLVYLNSEKKQESTRNFSVVIFNANKQSFYDMGLDSIAHFYLGETIEATGVIRFYDGNVVLEIEDFEDLRIL